MLKSDPVSSRGQHERDAEFDTREWRREGELPALRSALCFQFAGQLHSESAEVKGAAAGNVVCFLFFILKMPLQTEGMWIIFLLFCVIHGVCFASSLSCLIHHF